MKQLLITLMLAFLTFIPAVGQDFPLTSVQPMQTIVYDEMGVASLVNTCTVFSINEEKHYWATAYHCIEDEAYTYFIAGQKVSPLMKDVVNDLAVVSTPVATAPALKIAKAEPKLGEAVRVIGHPMGQTYPVLTVGIVSALRSQFEGLKEVYTLFQIVGAPGSSGSPIMNEQNEVVSVIMAGPGRNFAPILGGVPFEKLEVLGLWTQK